MSSSSTPAGDEIANTSRAAAETQQIELDELSKRFYYAGFLGLPWLWMVHVMNWHGKKKDVLRPDRTEQEIATSLREQAWVRKCRSSAIVVTGLWITWVLLVQVFLTDSFPASWFVRANDDSEATGW